MTLRVLRLQPIEHFRASCPDCDWTTTGLTSVWCLYALMHHADEKHGGRIRWDGESRMLTVRPVVKP